MQVCFMSWQDIIPVITGNESLWHSHKIDAQWQNLCSKASTALGSPIPPPSPPIKIKFQVQGPQMERKYWQSRQFWRATPVIRAVGYYGGQFISCLGGVTISMCSDSTWGDTLQIHYASASTFICSFSLQTTFVPPNTRRKIKTQNKYILKLLNKPNI